MAYSEALANRIRKAIDGRLGIREKKMFGGICFLLDGHMTLGVIGDEIVVRVGPADWERALAEPHTREMDFTGRSMRGMVYVSSEGLRGPKQLRRWIERGIVYASTLPPK